MIAKYFSQFLKYNKLFLHLYGLFIIPFVMACQGPDLHSSSPALFFWPHHTRFLLYILTSTICIVEMSILEDRLFTPHPPFLLWPHLIRYFFPYTYQYNMSCGDVHIWRHRFFTPAINKHKFFSRTTGLNICIIYGPPFNVSEYVHVIVFIFYPTRWWCTR